MMLIGMLYGRTEIGQDDETANAIARKWRDQFILEFGSEHCATIREGRTPEGEPPSVCRPLIVHAAYMLAEFLNAEARST
jgi:hypothetical protein